jgi:uncharacterized membrane protein YhaH (DUF805 family)
MQNQATDSTQAMNALGALGATTILIFVLVILALIALQLLMHWRIAVKAGFEGAYSLLLLIPFVNFVVMLIFAFGEWPIERRLKALPAGAPAPLVPAPIPPPPVA